VLVQLQHPDNWTAEGVAADAASDNDKFHGVLLFYEKNGDKQNDRKNIIVCFNLNN